MKVLTIIGARPQFIKAATVSREIAQRDNITEYLVHTGQHYDANMSEVFFTEMDIPEPDTNLEIGSASHGEQTGKMLSELEREMLEQNPDCVLVYGDTNSTLAGALAAAKLNIPVCHVEAGLRSFNRSMPEEINRILTDHASSLLFAPTQTALQRLQTEGISPDICMMSGDVMLDAALYYRDKAEASSTIIDDLELKSNTYILATIHRAENTDDPDRLARVMAELEQVAQVHSVVLPLHPRTQVKLKQHGLKPENIRIIEPLGYLDMVMMEAQAMLVITDSGGVQKEAFFHRKPCITLRTETEWTELVENGYNTLFSPLAENNKRLSDVVKHSLSQDLNFDRPLYGEGRAAAFIVDRIHTVFG